MDEWNPSFVQQSPMLVHLSDCLSRLPMDDWPRRASLQNLFEAADIRTASGFPLRAVEPDGREPYEIRVFRSGELEFRENNWHDLFNALSWIVFPKFKAALNARHHQALADEVGRLQTSRGRVRDALTLLDENGVIVASADQELLRMIREFRWKPLFWELRDAVVSATHFIVPGHALCEKALAPYLGMTGHGLLLEVEGGFFALNDREKVAYLDQRASDRITDPGLVLGPDVLSPIPVLGVPGWHEANDCAEFYDDRAYFRPGRRSKVTELDGTGNSR